MELCEGESKVKTFYHHPFPFFIRAVKIAIVSLPFYLVGSFFIGTFDTMQMFWMYFGISAFFVMFIAKEALLYFIDRLVVTNKRVVHVDWKNLFTRDESEVEIHEIQDIETKEFGILSVIPIFDYGTIHLLTASLQGSIHFVNANDPEGIKHFIYHLDQKPSKIGVESSEKASYDRTVKENQKSGVTRNSG